MPPKLFTAWTERVFWKPDRDNAGLRINGEYLGHWRITDDIVNRRSTSKNGFTNWNQKAWPWDYK